MIIFDARLGEGATGTARNLYNLMITSIESKGYQFCDHSVKC